MKKEELILEGVGSIHPLINQTVIARDIYRKQIVGYVSLVYTDLMASGTNEYVACTYLMVVETNTLRTYCVRPRDVEQLLPDDKYKEIEKRMMSLTMKEVSLQEREESLANWELLFSLGISKDNKEFNSIISDVKVSGLIELVSVCPVSDEDGTVDLFEEGESEFFLEERVDQWTTGDSGDSYGGFIYLLLKDKRWLRIPFNC